MSINQDETCEEMIKVVLHWILVTRVGCFYDQYISINVTRLTLETGKDNCCETIPREDAEINCVVKRSCGEYFHFSSCFSLLQVAVLNIHKS